MNPAIANAAVQWLFVPSWSRSLLWWAVLSMTFFVQGCEWKGRRVEAATTDRRPTIINPPAPRPYPLRPWLREGEPIPDPISTPGAKAHIIAPDGTEEYRPLTPDEEEALRPLTVDEFAELQKKLRDEQAKRDGPADGRELVESLATPKGAKPLGDAVKPAAKCTGPGCGQQQTQSPRYRRFFFRR